MFTIYSSNHIEKINDCIYSKRIEVNDEQSLAQAVSFDYVPVLYKGNYRNNNNFLESDCLVFDCDNTHSDSPDDWLNVSDVKTAFAGVSFAVQYSRNHMKEKDDRSARPKFHVLFPIDKVCNAQEYKDIKTEVLKIFPFFDRNAIDNARCFFGTAEPKVEIISGAINLDKFIHLEDDCKNIIPEGERNSTMFRYAHKLFKKYGNSDETYKKFMECAELCSPPLEHAELDNIWNGVAKFYNKLISMGLYKNNTLRFIPETFSDLGQAEVLAREYNSKLRYVSKKGYIVYNGSYWEDDDEINSHNCSQELTRRQFKEAEDELEAAERELVNSGVSKLLLDKNNKKAVELFNPQQTALYEKFKHALDYKEFSIKRQSSKCINAALNEAKTMLAIKPEDLDANEFLLNTPSFTYDLRLGLDGRREHNAKDFITHQTAVDPSDEGSKIWQEALNTIFCSDNELISYVQDIVGLASIGKVYEEEIIFCVGSGGNGKSTFWNSIKAVMGNYANVISSDVFTKEYKQNRRNDFVEAVGKRLLIASELGDGKTLDTDAVKKFCSTDTIKAEPKFKDQFNLTPQHTLILFTNYLPNVEATDEGSWRRLIVIPFVAKISREQDVKNYGSVLVEKGGGAILKWIIEGARRIIQNGFKPNPPQIVRDATQKYRQNCDWLVQFLDECCDVGKDYKAPSGRTYDTYKYFCSQSGNVPLNQHKFNEVLGNAGFDKKRCNGSQFFYGLKLKQYETV